MSLMLLPLGLKLGPGVWAAEVRSQDGGGAKAFACYLTIPRRLGLEERASQDIKDRAHHTWLPDIS